MSNHAAHLNRAFVEQQRKRLEALREQLLAADLGRLDRERSSQEERGGEAEEFEDKAQTSAANEINLALHDVDERRVRAVDRALQKIAEGSYGLSDLSGAPIAKARLESTPEAVLTVEEEAEKEQQDKR
jgi:DnaK suppressor protein